MPGDPSKPHQPDQPTVAQVDALVDENGARIAVPEAAEVTLARDVEQAVGATGPANWSRIALVIMGAIIAGLLLLQLLSGNPGTDVVPGTPAAAPEIPAPDAPSPAP